MVPPDPALARNEKGKAIKTMASSGLSPLQTFWGGGKSTDLKSEDLISASRS